MNKLRTLIIVPGTLSHLQECMRYLTVIKLIGAKAFGCQDWVLRTLRGWRYRLEKV